MDSYVDKKQKNINKLAATVSNKKTMAMSPVFILSITDLQLL